MCQIDPLFLENQLTAIKRFADEALKNDCMITLYSDSSIMVEKSNGNLLPFDSVLDMIENLKEHASD